MIMQMANLGVGVLGMGGIPGVPGITGTEDASLSVGCEGIVSKRLGGPYRSGR
jgi:hypothetical protein